MPFQYFQIIYTPLGNLYHKFKGKLSNPRDCEELPRDPPPNCWHCCCLYPHCRSCKKSVLKAANPDFRGVIFFPRHADFTCNIYNIYIICIHIYIYIILTYYIYIHYIYTHSWLLDTPSILVRLIPITIPSKPKHFAASLGGWLKAAEGRTWKKTQAGDQATSRFCFLGAN